MAPPPATDSHGSERMFRRHQELMQVYSASTRRSASITSTTSSIPPHNDQVSQNDLAVLKQKFQFIRNDEVDAEEGETDWQVRMSVRYYRQLFREYALADLSRYKEGKIGLRWRTEMEVIAGKGQFSCGNKRCDERTGLHSYELLFAYVEHGERKRCLVKVRACSVCAEKLFYKKMMEVKRKKMRKIEKRARKRQREGGLVKQKVKRRRRSASRSGSDSYSESDDSSGEMSSDHDVETEDIHELCAMINEEQKVACPIISHGEEALDTRDSEFDELLP